MLGQVRDRELQTLPRDFGFFGCETFIIVRPPGLSCLLNTHFCQCPLPFIYGFENSPGQTAVYTGEPQHVVFNYCLGDP